MKSLMIASSVFAALGLSVSAFAQDTAEVTMILKARVSAGNCPVKVVAGGIETQHEGGVSTKGWINIAAFSTGTRLVSQRSGNIEWSANLKPEYANCEGQMQIVESTRKEEGQTYTMPWDGHSYLQVIFGGGKVKVRTVVQPGMEDFSAIKLDGSGVSASGNPMFIAGFGC